jgi:FixJ family two-component response regulator
MADALPWIAIVDDDPSVLKALARLLRSRAYEAKTFTSARDFLAALPDGLPECLIVDLQMPEMSGLELQRHLTRDDVQIPTIIITATMKSVRANAARPRAPLPFFQSRSRIHRCSPRSAPRGDA